MKKKLIAFALIELVAISGIALASGYKVVFDDANWDTVLFLAPSGLITNLLDSTSIIRTFYFDPSPGQIGLSPTQIAFMALFYLGGAVNTYILIRGTKK